jgi:hypothetical protein
MNDQDKEKADKLAQEHWQWFQNVVGHIAKDFFIHGYKHGAQEREKDGKTD